MFLTILKTNSCSICKEKTNSHLLVDCDTCKEFFHITCLEPPLSAVPKKTKLFGWFVKLIFSCLKFITESIISNNLLNLRIYFYIFVSFTVFLIYIFNYYTNNAIHFPMIIRSSKCLIFFLTINTIQTNKTK